MIERILGPKSKWCYFRKTGLAKKYGCDVVCYGHTHVPMDQMSDGIRLINPGSLRYNRDGSAPGYMVLSVTDERIEARRFPYEP